MHRPSRPSRFARKSRPTGTVAAAALVLVVVAAAAPPAFTQPQDATLPVRRVVLYKHGVGYFEREGAVSGDATVALRFQQGEMGDVLKTLTALDFGGGSIAAIAYDSQKPADRVLSEFAFDLRTNDVLVSMLSQLRGAQVEIDVAGRVGPEPLRGAVLGLDRRTETRDGAEVAIQRLSILTAEGAVVGADLFDVRELRFVDDELSDEVARFLEVLRGTHRRDAKQVELTCTGEGERDLFVAYAVEQPVWKATYRIVLLGPDEPPLLQGWAVVDNASEEDWRDVTLSLVAGMPVSFRLDLYTPRYRERPSLDAVADQQVGFLTGMGRRAEKSKAGAPAAAEMDDASDAREEERRDRFRGALQEQQAQSTARELGELLEYRIDHPVTIPRNRSALLPIVAAEVEGGRVALFDESLRGDHPMSAVRLKNTSGLTLEGGPVLVLEEDTYAGEALIGVIQPDELKYVPFAVDLAVKATTKFDSRSDRVHHVAFVRGTMVMKYRQIDRKTYTFENRDDRARTVMVQHARRGEFVLREPDPQAPGNEQELDVVRFRLDVPAGATAALPVVEVRELQTTYRLGNVDDGLIASLVSQGALSPEAEASLREIVAANAEIADLRAQAARKRGQLAELDENQKRIRANLQALGQTDAEKDLVQRYVEQLARDEDAVAQLRQEAKDLEERAAVRQRELDARLESFALEYEPGR